jgi:uncharacterized protein with HEPN domain
MRHERDDPALLYNMIEAPEAVLRFIANRTREHYAADELLRAGVERKIEVIGEACRGISESLRKAHPEIPWQKISATRHVLAPDYDFVDDDVTWRIATIYVPDLLVQIRPLLPAPPVDPEPDDAEVT